jgi:hypothetical protein
MIKPSPPKSRGAAGVLFVCFFAVATAGVLIDMFVLANARVDVLAPPGARAMLGVGVAAAAVLTAFAMRWALGRPIKGEGGARARDHA